MSRMPLAIYPDALPAKPANIWAASGIQLVSDRLVKDIMMNVAGNILVSKTLYATSFAATCAKKGRRQKRERERERERERGRRDDGKTFQ